MIRQLLSPLLLSFGVHYAFWLSNFQPLIICFSRGDPEVPYEINIKTKERNFCSRIPVGYWGSLVPDTGLSFLVQAASPSVRIG